MKNVVEVCALSVESTDDGRKKITVSAYMPGNVELDPDDVAMLTDVLAEAAGRFEGGPAPEAEPEPEPEPEPAQPRRRRGAAAEEKEESKEEAAPRRRRGAAKEEPEAEAEEKPAGRRRRGNGASEPEKPKGPTADDVAKAASNAAQNLGPKVTAEIIGEFSDSGKLDGIPADKRQKFINTIRYELGEIEEDEIGD